MGTGRQIENGTKVGSTQSHHNHHRSIESSQGGGGPKQSQRFNKNDLATLSDPYNASVIIEKDKLLEPSKDRLLLEPSIEFQPEQKAQKLSKRSTNRSSVYNRNRQKAQEKRICDIPDFLQQAQDIGCKCNICR